MDLQDEDCYNSKIKEGKSKTCIPRLDVLELVPRRRRQGKCVGAVLKLYDFIEEKQQVKKTNDSKMYTIINNDIWHHLAYYIAPEDVQRYSLICTQSFMSVNSRGFWLNLYHRYCQQKSRNNRKWVLQLPEDLQVGCIKGYGLNTFRQSVIKALFYCYKPFQLRLQTPYNLDILIGRIYVSSWHKKVESVWMMCYKFKLTDANSCTQKYHTELEDQSNIPERESIVDNWECLAEESDKFYDGQKNTSTNDLDGTCLLVVCCDRFIPLPLDISYSHSATLFRFSGGRELLSSDMRSINLKLNFISFTGDQTITIKYTQVQKIKILPWWHPDFGIFNECK